MLETAPPSRPFGTRRFSGAFWLLGALVGAAGIFFSIARSNRPPDDFPVPYELRIEPGQSLFSISQELASEGAIRSRRLFEMWMLMFGSDRMISEGAYAFSKPVGALSMALRISGREFGVARKKITFPEGFTARDMAERLASSISGFDREAFIKIATPHEGYLFPDTYYFFSEVTPEGVVETMRENFDQQTKSLKATARSSGKKFSDIVVMASIIEREASGAEDRRLISGILWNRIAINKPLEVDAPLSVLLGKESRELTRKDLSLNVPSNTYRRPGLPPTPIANPGLAALEAALDPVVSPYLFYLHDARGTIHYAKTFEEHQKNIRTYLRNR